MKTGLSLTQMAAELERQQSAKRDFIADTRKVSFSPADMNQVTLQNGAGSIGTFGVNKYAHKQFAEHYDIPAKFYERMRGNHPDLLAATVNGLFQREPARRMLRVLDGSVRAFVSDRFRALDNFDLSSAVLPVLMDHKDLRVESTQFTEERFYLKAVFPRVQTEIKRGDVVQSGIVISNSEVGAGSLQVQPLIFRLVCLNGMVAPDYGQKRYHVGKRAAGDSDAAFEMFSDRTKALDDAALWAKVQDTVRGVLKADVFEKIVSRLREAAGERIEGKVEEVVEVTAKRFGYSDSTAQGVLRHLIEGGDLSRYGLMNAITRQSQDEDDYDLASRMEADGGTVIELPRSDWREIAEAA